jgi:NADH:ubiquinone oxidoreductase subunit C
MSTTTPEQPTRGPSAADRMHDLAATFRERLGERVLDTAVAYDGLTVTVTAEAWPQVVRFCKAELGMAFFDWLSAVDERDEGFAVVCRLYDHIGRVGVLLRAIAPGGREAPRFPTVTDVYRGADWHEREVYDMFGIVFEGHPGLLPRIFTVENFEGWPLRKEFKLATRVVKPWPGAKEPGEPGEEEGGASATSSKPTDDPATAGPVPGTDPGDRAAAAKAKAERAKAKAAEARKRKAEERAAAAGGPPPGTPERPADPAAPEAATAGDPGAGETIDDAEPGSARAAMAAAAGRPVEEGTPDPMTPEGAAEIAGTAIAKDAAAGVTAGQELAPGEQEDSDQPLRDPQREAEMGAGGPAQDSGAPGIEREGTHDLETSTARRDVSDTPQPDDEADRERAGVGPGTPGTLADSTRADSPDTSAGTDAPVGPSADEPRQEPDRGEPDEEPQP